MSDKNTDRFMMVWAGFCIGVIFAVWLCVSVTPSLADLPIGSEISHPSTTKWNAKGWQDNKGKIFEYPIDALNYLRSEAKSKVRELD